MRSAGRLDRVLAAAARMLAVGLLLSLAACPKSGVQKPPKAAGDTKGDSASKAGAMGKGVREVKTATLPQGMIGSEISLSGFYEDESPQDDPEAKQPEDQGEKGMVERAGGVPGRRQNAVKDVYKRVAPATVIIRSQRGYGSGVIYDPAGWILTNHHVIAHAWRENFRWKVKVALGNLKKSGVMEKREKLYDAYVHKIDPLLDLAVIKLIDPPKDLAAVPIAIKDATPGEAVSALGHAGIGLVWAIKDGQISAVGKLSTHLAQLMLHTGKDKKAGDKGDASLSPKMKRRMKFMRKKLKDYKKHLETKKPALVIQSTCDISQGDSGGPLVNRQSEIVGLNAFVRSGGMAKKESNFHIHGREIRKFVKGVPEKAPQLLPDPWVDGGSVAKLGDADMDQRIDVMVLHKLVSIRIFFRSLRKLRPQAYFLDLDQNSVEPGKTPKPADLLAKRSFDAEFIFMPQNNQLLAWYDTDNDGKQDVLLVASKYNNKVLEAFRIDAKGELKKDEALKKGPFVRPEIFKDSALGMRLTKAGQNFFSPSLLPRIKKDGKPNFPHPISGVGHEGMLLDYDRDGKADTLRAKGLFAGGFVFDGDQDTLGKHPKGTPLAKLLELNHKIDGEMTLIAQRRARWAWYDTDNDGHFELLLHNSGYPKSVVQQAWRVEKDGKSTPEKSQIGRLMVQPHLVAKQSARLLKLTARVMSARNYSLDAKLGGFPDPTQFTRYGVRLQSAKKLKDVAVGGRYGSCSALLIDLDRDSARKAKKEKTTLDKLVRQRKFDAEFAHLRCYGSRWTFYDTRGKGRYDTVLYSSKSGRGKATAYLIDKEGKVSLRKKAIGCEGMVLPRLFKKSRLRRTLAKVAPELLGAKVKVDAKCRP